MAILDTWKKEQEDIAKHVIVYPDNMEYSNSYPSFLIDVQDKLYGGLDVSFGEGNTAVAVYVVLRNFHILYQDNWIFEINVPYVSSYLAFREIEAFKRIVEKQIQTNPQFTPDVILVDGNGILHERRAGIASHLGVSLDIPTIGVAKKIYCTDGFTVEAVENGLYMQLQMFVEYCKSTMADDENMKSKDQLVLVRCNHAIEPFAVKRSTCYDSENMVHFISKYCDGFAVPLRTKDDFTLASALIAHGGRLPGITKKDRKRIGVKNPIFISVGHRISLHEAIEMCCGLSLTRIPEPIRQADLIGRKILINMKYSTS